jgi:hypothetical protein
MERERWESIYRMLCRWDQWGHRGLYSSAVIAAVYFWAVLHDRPVCWACLAKHWPKDICLRRHLPSQATMSRRLRQLDVQVLLTSIAHQLRCASGDHTTVKVVDAKPLPVGGYSRDPDARWGYAVRGFLKGYKLFAIWGNGPLPLCWRVGSMNLSEPRVAEQMMPEVTGRGYLLGDKVYDINRLYDAAHAANHQLLTDRKRPQAGLGHRRHSPHRLRAMKLLKTKKGRQLYQQRTCIERQFGGLTNFGGGLAPLPNWVRRLQRVQLWVHAKMIINALRLNNLTQPTATA